MAGTNRTQDKDVISRFADGVEDVLRRLVEIPRRKVGEVRDGADARLHDLTTKLRSIDPLDGRVTELERRLNSLEKPAKQPTRRTTTRAKRTATGPASTTASAKSEQPEHDPGPRDDATAKDAEKDDARTGGENEPTG
jgi:hypothetical protein